MSEFDKLMKGGSKRKDIEKRQDDRKKNKDSLILALGISFFISIIPPHIGLIVFLPLLLFAFFYSLREWMG